MIYIIGSGFSGLTTAYILRKKYNDIAVISPSSKKKTNKALTLLKYLLYFKGEIFHNTNNITKKIKFFENSEIKNCKFISSHQDGGLSNIWGGVLSNVYRYDISKFPYRQKDILRIKKEFDNLLKIIFKNKIKIFNKEIRLDKFITFLNFSKFQQNTINLKKYLKQKKIRFIEDFYLLKIEHKKKKLILNNLRKKEQKILNFRKIFIATGPINTAKIILNSFNYFKKIRIKETRHFYCFVKLNRNVKRYNYLTYNHKNLKFYCQLYNLGDAVNLFFKSKRFNFLNNYFKNFSIAQCFLASKDSGHIVVSKKKESNFLIEGYENKNLIKKIRNNFLKFNKKNDSLKFYFPILNSIGSSNHLGSSFPMSKIKKKKSTDLNGQLYKFKDIYISDSSVLNDVDMQPITTFSLLNILRMNLFNK